MTAGVTVYFPVRNVFGSSDIAFSLSTTEGALIRGSAMFRDDTIYIYKRNDSRL